MLHHLGDQRLAVDSDFAVLTREKDGSYALAIWSYGHGEQGAKQSLTINLKNLESRKAVVWRLDDDHGNVLRANAKMGSPRYPTQAQIEELRHAAQLPEAKSYEIKNHQLNLDLPDNSLLLVELK
jgi:xylan 1,4-beta-xylosidase